MEYKDHHAFKKFSATILNESDQAILVLKGHLFAENIFENLIVLKISRGDKLLEKASFTFSQKLALVEAMELLDDGLVSSLRALNKLRNKFAHDLDASVSNNDLLKVGSPLGTVFTKYKRESAGDDAKLLKKLINYLCGAMGGICYSHEAQEIVQNGL
ncbi:hypothetical protein KUL42_33320 [Alteromonas sp. KUL42]|uniref:hypothetical protein n=1 Tax=Alteromonas sp. KUL42 TaxID=2480797 RepID=UPI0010366E32|nr:hypothetical protein [Alteromonas sp. KUL42]TAP33341.1 hypothetical protein EYR97_15720 [Alteromonas sp. KUL42]GEA08571.1 hypothetical protein KUL42_33320 [Alteromonas sp. KUL42]